MKRLIVKALCLFSWLGALSAQTNCGPDYDRLIRTGDEYFAAGNYGDAFRAYRSALGCTGADLAYINNRMDASMKGIDAQRIQATKAQDDANAMRKEAEKKNQQLEQERNNAKKAQQEAERLLREAEIAQRRADSLSNILNAQLLAVQQANEEKMVVLRRDAGHQLSKLEYDSAFHVCRNMALIPQVEQAPAQLFLQEIAFFYIESGQFFRAREVFDLAKRTQPAANREDMLHALATWDKNVLDSLRRLYYPELLPVAGGYFLMGCIPGRDGTCELDETPQHYAAVRNFRMGRTEVTNRQYYLFAVRRDQNILPLERDIWADSPVKSVSWLDALEYLNWVSNRKGLTPVYHITMEPGAKKKNTIDTLIVFDQKANGYRLPTETEWEYAARGGQHLAPFRYAGSDTLNNVAWNSTNAQNIQPVAGLLPNELGLYDMSGNLAEWCWDIFQYYPDGSQVDYAGPKVKKKGEVERVVRGSTWANNNMRTAFRNKAAMSTRADWIGFRIAANQAPNDLP